MRCEYCNQENTSNRKTCAHCGAELVERKPADVWRSDPFFYNGYMVYLTRDIASDKVGCCFWLGAQLVERFEVPRITLDMLVPEGTDLMPFFWELLLVAQGEQEVLRIQEQNDKYPATFEIRRIENTEKTRWSSMSILNIVQEVRQ